MLLSVLELISSLLCLRLVLITSKLQVKRDFKAMCFCKLSHKPAHLSTSSCDLSKIVRGTTFHLEFPGFLACILHTQKRTDCRWTGWPESSLFAHATMFFFMAYITSYKGSIITKHNLITSATVSIPLFYICY